MATINFHYLMVKQSRTLSLDFMYVINILPSHTNMYETHNNLTQCIVKLFIFLSYCNKCDKNFEKIIHLPLFKMYKKIIDFHLSDKIYYFTLN